MGLVAAVWLSAVVVLIGVEWQLDSAGQVKQLQEISLQPNTLFTNNHQTYCYTKDFQENLCILG